MTTALLALLILAGLIWADHDRRRSEDGPASGMSDDPDSI